MYCSKCGAKLEIDDKFCMVCGEKNISYEEMKEDDDVNSEETPEDIIEEIQDNSNKKNHVFRNCFVLFVVVVIGVCLVKNAQIKNEEYIYEGEYEYDKCVEENDVEEDNGEEDINERYVMIRGDGWNVFNGSEERYYDYYAIYNKRGDIVESYHQTGASHYRIIYEYEYGNESHPIICYCTLEDYVEDTYTYHTIKYENEYNELGKLFRRSYYTENAYCVEEYDENEIVVSLIKTYYDDYNDGLQEKIIYNDRGRVIYRELSNGDKYFYDDYGILIGIEYGDQIEEYFLEYEYYEDGKVKKVTTDDGEGDEKEYFFDENENIVEEIRYLNGHVDYGFNYEYMKVVQ